MMSTFLKLDESDPYETFAVVMRRSQLSMRSAYNAAFAAHIRCADLLKSHRWGSFSMSDPLGFPVFGLGDSAPPEPLSRAELDGMWLEALAEDFQADMQAAPVILTADDSLRRFARGVLGKPPALEDGFGPTYGKGVHLTSLLQAATNALRHVSEWDETKTPAFPYKTLDQYKEKSPAWQAMRSIRVIQAAFGIGDNGPIRDVVSARVLIAVDGQLGTAEPSYDRFEAAVLTTAHEIAKSKGPTPARKLEEALNRQRKLVATVGH